MSAEADIARVGRSVAFSEESLYLCGPEPGGAPGPGRSGPCRGVPGRGVTSRLFGAELTGTLWTRIDNVPVPAPQHLQPIVKP